ncbi:Na+/H+ antiporter NhaA [Shigella flexneri]
MTFSGLTSMLPLGIIAGLFIGKLLGISLFGRLALSFELPKLPGGRYFSQITAVGLLCGIGFTMSIFIASLAFAVFLSLLLINWAKLGILAGSWAVGGGYTLLRR